MLKALEKSVQRNDRSRRAHIQENYVNADRFRPVERVVYGAVGVIGLAVICALVALVVE